MTCANHPDRERTAFCQNCGKPLCPECTRTIGTAVFCEPCLAERLAGTGAPVGAVPDSSGFAAGPDVYGVRYTPTPGEPNPGLAALLGFIPGVGAMYNGQYAKGVVHLIVFAILVSLADEHGIFGLFIAGWVIYQVIEAHHTARARRDGTPLPNPFGLNDLGERLGFGKSWPNNPGTPASAPQSAGASSTNPPPASSAYTTPPYGYPPQPGTANWNTPWDSSYNYVPPVPPIPPIPPYGAPAYPIDPNLAPLPRNRFPTGAIWLIGLGCLFLIGNAGLFHAFPAHWFIPIILIGFGVWVFVRKMTDTGTGIADDGSPGYQFRLFRALRGSVWIILIGVLFLLDTSGVLSWHNSWPVIIIVAGLMAIFQRTTYSAAMAASYPYPAPPAPVPPPADPGTSIVPSTQHDEEGR